LAALGLLSLYLSDPTVLEAVGYPSPDRRLLSRPLTSPAFTYDFVTPPSPVEGSGLPIINTQVLIIGSGAGGGVVASRLAEDYETLVIDKGVYAPTGEKHRGQSEALEEMYQNGGFFASESGTISVLAGSVFGGGTAINWSGSLKTQHYVREEWAKKKGLGWFLSKGYSDALDAVRSTRSPKLTTGL
jgi:long-chain-alcohol oxidase